MAFKSGDRHLYKVAKSEFEKAVTKAKADYRRKLENKLSSNDSRGVWEGLKQKTNYTSIAPGVSDDDPELPDSLSEFYCCFDKSNTSHLTQPRWVNRPSPPFVIEEDEVRLLLKKQNCRKAAGPDLVSSATISWLQCSHIFLTSR